MYKYNLKLLSKVMYAYFLHMQRPSSRESVGTRFLREDQQHQAELERILNAHIHDLELKTTNTLAKHSQRLNKIDS